jgi:hypothetical protein
MEKLKVFGLENLEENKMRNELKKKLREVELKRIEMDFYGGSKEEYLKLCEEEKELREQLYNADYREITKEEVEDFIQLGY